MIFNGDSDNQDICTLADKMAKTDDTSYPLTEKATDANWALREIMSIIMEVYGGWIYDDSNNAGNPEATINLVSGTQVYPFATAQAIFAMEYEDTNGHWFPIKPITLEQITEMKYAESEFMTVSGNPIYYRPVKNGVKLYPASNFNVTSGLKAHILRDVTAFTSASTTAVPGFDSALHESVPTFMALQYASINSLDVTTELQKKWDGGEYQTRRGKEGGFVKMIKDHYRRRFQQEHPQLRKEGFLRDSVRQYI